MDVWADFASLAGKQVMPRSLMFSAGGGGLGDDKWRWYLSLLDCHEGRPMLSKACRTAAILVVASLFWIFSVANVQGSHPAALPVEDTSALNSTEVVYSQPPSPGGGLFQSSLLEPDGSASDEWVWDDFTLSSTQAITEVQWRGGYKFGHGGPVIGFTLKIYPTNQTGLEPDVAHAPKTSVIA